MGASDRSVARFLLIAFGVTWGLQLPGVLSQRGLLPGPAEAYLPFVGLGIFGPLVAAVVLARREGGRAGVRALLAPLLRWRVHAGWYVAALVVPGALLTGLLALLSLVGREGPLGYPPGVGALPGDVVPLVVHAAVYAALGLFAWRAGERAVSGAA